MKMRGALQMGGTAPVGNQAAGFTTNRPPSPPVGFENPRQLIFWLAFVAVLFAFHVGGARLP